MWLGLDRASLLYVDAVYLASGNCHKALDSSANSGLSHGPVCLFSLEEDFFFLYFLIPVVPRLICLYLHGNDFLQ